MAINRRRLFHVFKYAVYALLSLNILLFLQENLLAAERQFPGGVPMTDIIDTFAETIDTAAWVVLLLMFELETTVSERHQPTLRHTRNLKGVRILCYSLIVYAFYGYLVRAIASAAAPDTARLLAWLDVINAATWLVVVLILEMDVRLQARSRFKNLSSLISNASKAVLYVVLLLAAIYWGIRGDFVDFWDAFLWLLAFVAIELNVFGWRQATREKATVR